MITISTSSFTTSADRNTIRGKIILFFFTYNLVSHNRRKIKYLPHTQMRDKNFVRASQPVS